MIEIALKDTEKGDRVYATKDCKNTGAVVVNPKRGVIRFDYSKCLHGLGGNYKYWMHEKEKTEG
jgi:hypothetical protein